MAKKTALIILDGWGHGDHSKSDAIFNADTPFVDSLHQNAPNAELRTDGENVGLPKGQMGNSEVGHLNIGAGRVVDQELTKINKAINSGAFFDNEVMKNAFQQAKESGKKVHLLGLVSAGGVHSSLEHLYALSAMTQKYDLKQVYIHAFTDGRDCDPYSAETYFAALEEQIKDTPVQIASVIGRYYAMDRDRRWERIKKAYDLMVNGRGAHYSSAKEGILDQYQKNVTDEFLEPMIVQGEGEQSPATIDEGDTVVSFNFRTDRCRQITTALTQKKFPDQIMEPLDLNYYTMTEYDKNFNGINVIFKNDFLKNTLGEVLEQNDKTQLRIAETEKYPHVTFFFNGGRENPFQDERRILINSPKVATYDLQPEMSAIEVRDALMNDMKNNAPDFICANFANPDMVGHTGVYSAIQKAVETVDDATQKIVDLGQKLGYNFVIIADHGNADFAINEDGSANTAHSLNPVPVIVLGEEVEKVSNGILADIAPTICRLLDIEQPQDMTGKSLI